MCGCGIRSAVRVGRASAAKQAPIKTTAVHVPRYTPASSPGQGVRSGRRK